MSKEIPTPSFSVSLTEPEANALLQLLHEAVKAAGLNGPHAANAIHLQNKLNEAHKLSKIVLVPEKPKQVGDALSEKQK